MNTLKAKITIVLAMILTIVLLFFSFAIYRFNTTDFPQAVTPSRMKQLINDNPVVREFIENIGEDEEITFQDVMNEIEKAQLKEYSENIIRLLIPTLGVSVIIAYIAATYLTRPIDELTDDVRKLSGEDIGERISERPSSEEIECLIVNFNELLDRVENAFDSQERFIQDAAHELRTPLASIKANLDVIQDKKKVSLDEYSTLVDSLSSLNTKLIGLSEDLLYLDRKSAEQIKKVNISLLTEDVIESLLPQINAKKISLETKIQEDVFVKGRETDFVRAVSNLIENSIKYSKKSKAKISVHIENNDGNVAIEIKDNGLGISKDDIDNVFDRFYRSSKTSEHGIDGSGLGLSIVKKVVDEHNGDIVLKSRLNSGTTVTIFLVACL